MFSFIKGLLVEANPERVILDCQGIGYCLWIPASHYSLLPPLGNSLLLYSSLVIREQSHTLYGFVTVQERDLYEQLMGVSGIGPKLALAIVGHLSPARLSQALADSNIEVLTEVPGIGKRTAERLIVELKGKLTDYPAPFVKSLPLMKEQKLKDAVSALINLGYTQAHAQKAVKSSLELQGEEIDLATLITTSLTRL